MKQNTRCTGTQKGFATITLDDGNNFTAQVVAEYFDSSSTIYLTKCIDVVGTRLNGSQPEPYYGGRPRWPALFHAVGLRHRRRGQYRTGAQIPGSHLSHPQE